VKETRIDEREATVLRDLIIRGDYVLKTACTIVPAMDLAPVLIDMAQQNLTDGGVKEHAAQEELLGLVEILEEREAINAAQRLYLADLVVRQREFVKQLYKEADQICRKIFQQDEKMSDFEEDELRLEHLCILLERLAWDKDGPEYECPDEDEHSSSSFEGGNKKRDDDDTYSAVAPDQRSEGGGHASSVATFETFDSAEDDPSSHDSAETVESDPGAYTAMSDTDNTVSVAESVSTDPESVSTDANTVSTEEEIRKAKLVRCASEEYKGSPSLTRKRRSLIPKVVKNMMQVAESKGIITFKESADVINAFAKGHEVLQAAWEVFEQQQDHGDLMDTLLRIARSGILASLDEEGGSSLAGYEEEVEVDPEEFVSMYLSIPGLVTEVERRGIPGAELRSFFESLDDESASIAQSALEVYAADQDVHELADSLTVILKSKNAHEKSQNVSAKDNAAESSFGDAVTHPACVGRDIRGELLELVVCLLEDNKMPPSDGEALQRLIEADDPRVLAAYDTYAFFQDVDDLIDTLVRVARRVDSTPQTPPGKNVLFFPRYTKKVYDGDASVTSSNLRSDEAVVIGCLSPDNLTGSVAGSYMDSTFSITEWDDNILETGREVDDDPSVNSHSLDSKDTHAPQSSSTRSTTDEAALVSSLAGIKLGGKIEFEEKLVGDILAGLEMTPEVLKLALGAVDSSRNETDLAFVRAVLDVYRGDGDIEDLKHSFQQLLTKNMDGGV